MTNGEFSNQFDLLVSSYRRFKDFDKQEMLDSIEFDEYEKSVFLTKAQEELVLSLYTGRNSYGDSYDETEELKRYLANLVLDASLSPIVSSSGHPVGVESNSKFFTLPENLWFIVYEAVTLSDAKCENNNTMEVVPVRHDEYNRLRKNPFRGANDRRALRLDLSEGVIEIVSKFTVSSYYLRYLRKPQPIVLEKMPEGVTVEGVGTASSCELHSALHEKILELAVTMALQSKGYNTRSESSGDKKN